MLPHPHHSTFFLFLVWPYCELHSFLLAFYLSLDCLQAIRFCFFLNRWLCFRLSPLCLPPRGFCEGNPLFRINYFIKKTSDCHNSLYNHTISSNPLPSFVFNKKNKKICFEFVSAIVPTCPFLLTNYISVCVKSMCTTNFA